MDVFKSSVIDVFKFGRCQIGLRFDIGLEHLVVNQSICYGRFQNVCFRCFQFWMFSN